MDRIKSLSERGLIAKYARNKSLMAFALYFIPTGRPGMQDPMWINFHSKNNVNELV